jgi:hypothetical protein
MYKAPVLLVGTMVLVSSSALAEPYQRTYHAIRDDVVYCQDRGTLLRAAKSGASATNLKSAGCDVLAKSRSFELEYTAEGAAMIILAEPDGVLLHKWVAVNEIELDSKFTHTPWEFGHPPIESVTNGRFPATVYDICAVKEGEPPKIAIGCRFDLKTIGHDRTGFHIERASPGAELRVAERVAALSGRCKQPADRVYTAYSPYRGGVLFVVRDDVLIIEQPMDRFLAKDYQDTSKAWAPWPRGIGKGFLACDELTPPVKFTTTTAP